ncbi:cysteine hydrolase family protein [Undibacterium baiyunense]|uniref:Cysteine hydrolase n=1 Tax=Undibacterium baiyunense TaxID=2828731 RepID=A0A941DG34_9BURK|nr:cysteine hydrolase family protein [Undibacterium baiyunense]MBR7746895.1 cysteine hydrolase [Undibacterium baiyunense]
MLHPHRFAIYLLTTFCPFFAFAQEAKLVSQPALTKSALLIVDAQVGVMSSVWESQRVVNNIEKLVSKARSAGVPVIWVQHSDNDELKFGSANWKLLPNFVPTSEELIIHKKYNSSFAGTDLEKRLRALGASRLVLAGALTNWCIRSTAYAALERGYHLVLASDAHSTESLKLPDGKTVPAESIVAELNSVFSWVSAPRVRTEVERTNNVRF